DALAAQAELPPRLGPGGDRNLHPLAVHGRDLHLAAKAGGHHGDGHPAEDMGAVPLEDGVRLEAEEDVKVARRPAAQARLALAAEANARAVVDAGRDLDLQGALLVHAALAAAGGAGIGNELLDAMAGRAGALHHEEALLGADLAAAVAGPAQLGLRPRLGAAAVALAAGDGGGAGDRCGLAAMGFLEGDLEIVSEVGAA